MRVAAIQMCSGRDVAANLEDADRLVSRAASAGAQLVVLPENFALMAADDAERLRNAEAELDGPIQDFARSIARKQGVWLVAGTIALRTESGERVRSACFLFDSNGETRARYDKIHLFDVRLENGEHYRESAAIEPGSRVVVADTPVGRMGLAVCYDLRFPELFRRMLDSGAELFAVPSAFTALTGKAHWEVLLRARAVENLSYVIGADQGGRHGNGRETYGSSMIVDPWGTISARLDHGAGIATAEIDADYLQRVRGSLPSIRHRALN
jgi:nitrilase